MTDHDSSRRDFVKKTLYVAPAILTFQATLALAKGGSEKPGGTKPGKGHGRTPRRRRGRR